MPRPKSHNSSRVQTLWYNYKGLWEATEPHNPEDDEDPSGKPKRKPMVKDRKVQVDVWLHKKTDDSESTTPPYPVKEVYFELRCPSVKVKHKGHSLGSPLSFEGPDIEILRKAVWGALDEEFAVKWEHYLLVEVELRRPYSCDGGQSVEVKWADVEKGTAHDGTLLLKKYEHNEFVVKPWPGAFKDSGGKVLACIPKSDANEKALEEFAKRFSEVGEAMKKMLRPANIETTLALLNRTAGLPLLAENVQVVESLEEEREATGTS